LREGVLFISINTWYKYSRRLGIKRKFFRLKHKREIGIRASNPLKIFHMDVTIFKPLDNSRIYIYLLVDNYSRYILGWKASLEFSSKIALQVLKQSIEKYNIDFGTKLIVDGGSEYKGEVTEFNRVDHRIVKLIAQKDIIQPNSMVEAINKHLKYYYF